jgi:hypothetical protein
VRLCASTHTVMRLSYTVPLFSSMLCCVGRVHSSEHPTVYARTIAKYRACASMVPTQHFCADLCAYNTCLLLQVVAATGYPDVITLVQGKMEEVKLPGK